MMKKVYLTPAMEIVELQNSISLLAGSNLDVMNGVNFDDAEVGSGLEADAPQFGDIDITFME